MGIDTGDMWICQFSNLVMLAPIVAAVQYKLYFVAASILFCTIASFVYHTDETNPNLFLFDLMGIICMVSVTAYMLLFARKSFTYVNLMTCVYMGIGMYFFLSCPDPWLGFQTDQEAALYQYNHSAWHVFVGYSIFGVTYSFLNSAEDYSQLASSMFAAEKELRNILSIVL